MDGRVSERLLDQRLRNRIMEAVLWLADGVDSLGLEEYFNQFYDQMGLDDRPQPNSTLNPEEAGALDGLCDLVNQACDATPDFDETRYASSSWPGRLERAAQDVLHIFLRRGRFDENTEQADPSFDEGQSWHASARGGE